MKSKVNIKKICVTAVFTAVIAALSQIAVPTPVGVSVTLQTFAIALAAFLLDTKCAVAATLCYVALGAAGAPVFTGFAGGAGVLLGASGGFIFGFPVFCLLLSLSVYVNRKIFKTALCALSLIVLYAAGILQFVIVTGNSAEAAVIAFFPYFIKDVLVLAAVWILCGRTRERLKTLIQPK